MNRVSIQRDVHKDEPAASAVAAGDATTPATWLGTLSTAQITLDAAETTVELIPTGTAYDCYIAQLDSATWRYMALVSVGAYTSARVLCPALRGLAFGIAGGATINVLQY